MLSTANHVKVKRAKVLCQPTMTHSMTIKTLNGLVDYIDPPEESPAKKMRESEDDLSIGSSASKCSILCPMYSE